MRENILKYLKYVSRKSWSCWWSLTWIFVCLLQYSLQISNENWTYRLLPWLSLCGLFWKKKCPVWAFVEPSSNILSSMVLTSSTTVNSTMLKDVNFVKLMWETAPITSEAFYELQKDFLSQINFSLPGDSANISTHSYNCEVFTNIICP